MNKKAIELSINFLVIVIISLVMLSTGILLIKKYFGTATDIKEQLDEQTVEQIEGLLDEGNSVAMPLKRKTVEAGANELFGLGVINLVESRVSFNVDVKFSNAYDRAKDDITAFPQHPDEWLLYEKSFSLDFKESKKVPIRVSVPGGVSSGTYIYTVYVCQNAATCEGVNPNRYGLVKMYVLVP
jgi:hypothetical protein